MFNSGLTAPKRDSLEEHVRLLNVKEDAEVDPKALINEIRYFDPSSSEWVEFKMFPPDDWEPPVIWLPNGEWKFVNTGAADWHWQSMVIDWFNDPTKKKYLILKARQLGITLLSCAYGLWLMLYRPGSVVVAYSYNEDEAKKLVEAAWEMFRSLPEELKAHVTLISPKLADTPTESFKIRDKRTGLVSSFTALPATPKHGHGIRATFAIMDEVAYMEHAKRIYTAINPAVSRGKAKLIMISTAYGVSNLETGEGNYFHHLYATMLQKSLNFRFLPWNLEPTRDEEWYEREAMALDEVERNQQYPLKERDAFMLSGHVYFDREALDHYDEEGVRVPLFQGQFFEHGRDQAELERIPDGIIEVYRQPIPGRTYGMGVDSATGRGTDYTSAHVIDMSSGEIVAEMHARIESPRAAFQVWWLGTWYNNALIAVERQGGYGDAIIYALRDGNNMIRNPYTNLYRQTKHTSLKRPQSQEYGVPMGPTNRGSVLDNLKNFIRLRFFPYLSRGTLDELGTFVYAETNPSPRAQDGTNDDRVMSLALAALLYAERGKRQLKVGGGRQWKKKAYSPSPVRSAT
jgi:hypothetical protein